MNSVVTTSMVQFWQKHLFGASYGRGCQTNDGAIGWRISAWSALRGIASYICCYRPASGGFPGASPVYTRLLGCVELVDSSIYCMLFLGTDLWMTQTFPSGYSKFGGVSTMGSQCARRQNSHRGESTSHLCWPRCWLAVASPTWCTP